MAHTLTIPVQDAVYLTPAQRMTCREAIARVQLSIASYAVDPSPYRRLETAGFSMDLQKVMDLI